MVVYKKENFNEKKSLRVSFADKELPEDQIKTQFEETCQ